MTELQQSPTAADEPALTDHAYDGIREYDNPTPGWWTWIFVGTVVFSAIYFFIMTLTGNQLSAVGFYERYKIEEMKAGGALKADAATLMGLSKDADSLKAGAAVFTANCISCHARDGSGLTGTNLTDDKYVNVKTITDIVDIVRKGRNNGAMPAWGNRLGGNDIVQVSAYVASLRGQNKPGKAVEPNAVTIPPWSE